jgi:hypothetical protein
MVATLAATMGIPFVTAGCGAGAGKTAEITPGDMPAGSSWTGVWYSELYGYLHLVQDGNAVAGKWLRPHKDRWGELKGKTTGNVIRFEWTEHTIGLVGPNAQKKGKGYFKFSPPTADQAFDTLAGEIGRGEDETGDPWEAIRQKDIMPDLASIGGSGAGDLGGGDWDSENKEQGSPEAPAEPQAPSP